MKKTLAFILALCMVFCLVACGSSSAKPAASDTAPSSSGSASSDAGSIKIIMAHANAEDSSPQEVFNLFKEYVEKTDPTFVCEIYPLAQLGGDREMLESCQEGTIQVVAMATTVVSNFTPEFKVFDLPFAIRSGAEIKSVLKDPEFAAAIDAACASIGLKLGFISGGSWEAMTSRTQGGVSWPGGWRLRSGTWAIDH